MNKPEGFYSTFRLESEAIDNSTVATEIGRQDQGASSAAAALKCERECHLSQLKANEESDHDGIVDIWELRHVASYRIHVQQKLVVEKLP
jgi:hypothetical protein